MPNAVVMGTGSPAAARLRTRLGTGARRRPASSGSAAREPLARARHAATASPGRSALGRVSVAAAKSSPARKPRRADGAAPEGVVARARPPRLRTVSRAGACSSPSKWTGSQVKPNRAPAASPAQAPARREATRPTSATDTSPSRCCTARAKAVLPPLMR